MLISQYPGTRKDVVRDSGISVIGDVEWGTHFCLFYRTREDLIDVLVPYFEAGLRNNELCMCITSEPFSAKEFRSLMREAVPGFDEYLRKGQIEIIPQTEWYKKDGVFNPERVLNGWVEKLHQAMARGYDGLRLTGNLSWLEKSCWKDFLDYEQELNETIDQYHLIALCGYPLDTCSASDVLDVASTHQFAMTRCEGEWKVIQNKQVYEDRERLLKEIDEQRRRLQAILDALPVGVFITDATGQILQVNDRAREIWGGKVPLADSTGGYREYKGRWTDTGEPVMADEWPLARAIKNGEIILEKAVDIDRFDGTHGTSIYSAAPVRDAHGNITGGVVIGTDITDRKRIEDDLRKLSMAVEQSPATVVITDTQGKIEYVNPKFTRLTGYTPEEAIGQNPRILKSGETPTAVYKELWKTIISGKEWQGEFHNKKKNGELYWESALIAPVKDDTGKIRHFLAVKEDITERKRAEQDLKEAKMQADLYLDLMCHDINNLNQIALGYLELANEMVTDEKLRECLSKPLDAIHSSTYLIENVGKLQKVKSGELKIELIDLNDILTLIQAQYSKIPDKDVTITFTPRNKSTVMANGLIKDVFSNLAWNSIKHSSGSSVRINIDLERQQTAGKAYYKVIVEDNGPGIPDMQKEKIFARFHRGNTKASGKGLGLYLVKTLVENFKGRVWVEDRVPGDHTKGAKFIVMLPASE